MPIVPLPLKPSKGQPWLNVGDAWYDNVAQFLLDVPAFPRPAAADVTALPFTDRENVSFTGAGQTCTGLRASGTRPRTPASGYKWH